MLDGQILMSIGNLHVLELAFQISHLLQVFLQHVLCSNIFGYG
jgi:hypothetical protein